MESPNSKRSFFWVAYISSENAMAVYAIYHVISCGTEERSHDHKNQKGLSSGDHNRYSKCNGS